VDGSTGATHTPARVARSRTGSSKKRRREGSDGGLKVGLLAAVQDRQEPCIVDGCTETWTYSARGQLENLGRNAPAGRCPRHLADEYTVVDRQEPCRVGGCARTWEWSAALQMEALFPDGYMPGSPPRKIRAPSRMCALCFEKMKSLGPRSVACKVHGCSREATADRDSLIRAWAALGTEDLSEDPAVPRRMCDVCRDYCRGHKDRAVSCVRAGCENTWTFKTGAQLQAFLAGRVDDPGRPCGACESADESVGSVEQPAGLAQTMPCVVRGCRRTWAYAAADPVAAASEGSLPLDRMCSECRSERSS
jgi:hypothetical protein